MQGDGSTLNYCPLFVATGISIVNHGMVKWQTGVFTIKRC